MENVRKAYSELMDHLTMEGNDIHIYQLYEEARNCGNEYIDFHDVIWEKNVEKMITNLRKNGISHFTFSSGWSSAVDTAWLFIQNGCTLEGLIEINRPSINFETGEHEKAHGYLFRIQ